MGFVDILLVCEKMVVMQIFQNNFETHKQSFISVFSICMNVPSMADNISLIIDVNM